MTNLRFDIRATRERGRGRGGGFTLLELVVALGMVAIIAASLASTLWSAYHETKTAEAVVTPSRQAAIAMEFLANDLQNALQPGTELASDFEATQAQDDRGHEADDVIFYSTADGPQHAYANGEIKKIELTVEEPTNTNDHVLVRRVTRNLLGEVEPAPDEEIICRGVSSLTFQYYDGSNWNPTWDSTQEDRTIPAAVQITLELEEPQAKGPVQTTKYMRIVLLPCSMAALDSTVNSGAALP